MASLGNSDAVKAGNAKERERRTGDKMREPVKPGNPATETAETRAATPERKPEPKPAAQPERKLSHYEEWEADLKRAIPGITENALDTLKRQYYKEA